jgi:hypothetical protein
VSYSVFFLPRAEREFAALSKSYFVRVKRAIDVLAESLWDVTAGGFERPGTGSFTILMIPSDR